MDSLMCYFWLLISSTTYLLLLRQTPRLVLAHSLFHNHHLRYGIPTNVTNHLHFPSFSPKYSNSNPTSDHIKLLGSATISQDKGSIQIPNPSPTLDHAHQAGRAIFSSPIRLFEPLTLTSASFNTTFSFHFTPNQDSFTRGKADGGDGLAFVIVPDEFTVGRPGPWLGILNDACAHYNVFAIEFDTIHDPEVGDPNDDHVGINLGSVVSFKVANLSEANVSLHDHLLIHRAWIVYDGFKRWIDVYLGIDGEPLPPKPILSSPLNLAPFFKEYMFVGFSASTGNSVQIHNILSWNFSSTIQAFLHVPSRHTCHRNVAHQVSKYSSFSHSNRPSSFLIFVCVLALVSVALVSFYCNSKSTNQSESTLAFMFPEKKQKPTPPSRPRRFTFLEIYGATRRFSKVEMLASGVGGAIYRGTLPSGRHLTVKRFSAEFYNLSRLDWSRVLKRISSITSICHPSLASVRGWCYEHREMIVVYDYFQNGSLERWLFGLGVLPWTQRLKLIKEIAEAMSFLHSKELTHGNLRTSSVFIDVNYQAVLGDYGFIQLQGESSGKFDSVSGKKSDAYNFGMLLLEIVAGKRTIKGDKGEEEEMGLLEFAWIMHERGETAKVVDEGMASNCVNLEQVVRVLGIGLSCTLSENNGRPSMEDVVMFLNMQKQIPNLPSSRPSHMFAKNKTFDAIQCRL